MRHDNEPTRALGIALNIVRAPMAGRPTTPAACRTLPAAAPVATRAAETQSPIAALSG